MNWCFRRTSSTVAIMRSMLRSTLPVVAALKNRPCALPRLAPRQTLQQARPCQTRRDGQRVSGGWRSRSSHSHTGSTAEPSAMRFACHPASPREGAGVQSGPAREECARRTHRTGRVVRRGQAALFTPVGPCLRLGFIPRGPGRSVRQGSVRSSPRRAEYRCVSITSAGVRTTVLSVKSPEITCPLTGIGVQSRLSIPRLVQRAEIPGGSLRWKRRKVPGR